MVGSFGKGEKMKHVGGHSGKTWIDEGALKALLKEVKAETFLDIGCGPGGQIDIAESLGLKAYGLDGDPFMAKNAKVTLCDFSVSKVDTSSMEYSSYDIGWSTEFLEHVEAEYIENFMSAFEICKYVVFTHATPGQGGYHHVNEQPFEYWKKIFEDYGFEYDEGLTKKIKEASTMRKKKLNHFKGYGKDGEPINIKKRSSFMIKTGRVFVKRS